MERPLGAVHSDMPVAEPVVHADTPGADDDGRHEGGACRKELHAIENPATEQCSDCGQVLIEPRT
jgi:hypothetical protein